MHRMRTTFLLTSLFFMGLTMASAETATVGSMAPDFTLTDTNGNAQTLSSYKGKFVVLEWNNPDCPFVVRHYATGNMQNLQKTYTGKGAVWLSINSSAEGKQGHYDGAKHNEILAERGAAPSALLLDSDGAVGRLYEAKTTPHMFVINPEGTIVYNGAIDDDAAGDKGTGAKNYVSSALDEAMAGQPVSTSSNKPYGCSVKYAS